MFTLHKIINIFKFYIEYCTYHDSGSTEIKKLSYVRLGYFNKNVTPTLSLYMYLTYKLPQLFVVELGKTWQRRTAHLGNSSRPTIWRKNDATWHEQNLFALVCWTHIKVAALFHSWEVKEWNLKHYSLRWVQTSMLSFTAVIVHCQKYRSRHSYK